MSLPIQSKCIDCETPVPPGPGFQLCGPCGDMVNEKPKADILPCPFCNGEVKRQKSDPEMMVHVGMYKCVFGLSSFTVEKWNRRTYKERQEKGMDPVTDYILKAEPEDLAEMCNEMGTTIEAESNWVRDVIKKALFTAEHPAFCDMAEDKAHYFPNNRKTGRGPCVHCGRTVKEAFEKGKA